MKKKKSKITIKELALLAVAVLAVVAIIVILCTGHDTKEAPGTALLKGSDYSCGVGYEGLRVRRVKQLLDLGDTTDMGGAYYSEDVAAAVEEFQKEKDLPVTGEVDVSTWLALGLNETEWELCGGYRSSALASASDTPAQRIEAMIDRAYDYLGDPYVIGASGPPGRSYGLDCSGLIMQALYAADVAMDDINPVTHAWPGHEYESRNLWHSDYFTVVSYEDLTRGDLVFYGNADGIVTHVALYLGDEQVIESLPGGVQISPVIDERHSYVIGVKRVFAEETSFFD